jgi:hypothetical protein
MLTKLGKVVYGTALFLTGVGLVFTADALSNFQNFNTKKEVGK